MSTYYFLKILPWVDRKPLPLKTQCFSLLWRPEEGLKEIMLRETLTQRAGFGAINHRLTAMSSEWSLGFGFLKLTAISWSFYGKKRKKNEYSG